MARMFAAFLLVDLQCVLRLSSRKRNFAHVFFALPSIKTQDLLRVFSSLLLSD
jgi:hypothetical protein